MNQYQDYKLKNPTPKFLDSIKKTVIKAGAVAEDGQEYAVSLWKNDWEKYDLRDGDVIRAEMKITEKNGFKNVTLYPERTKAPAYSKGTQSLAGVKAAQERKAEFIEKAQDRKNESIAYFNAINSAISLAKIMPDILENVPFPTEKDVFSAIFRYRDEFLKEWEKYEAKELQDKHSPF